MSLFIFSTAYGGNIRESSSLLSPDSTGSAYIQQYLVQDQWHGYCIPVRSSDTHPFVDIHLQAKWYDEPAHIYRSIVNPTGDSILNNRMLGYFIYSNSASGSKSTISVTGTPNTGPVSIGTTCTIGPDGPDGWNLIGNPYPSGVFWTSMALTNVDPTMYIFDPQRGNYVFWNLLDMTHTTDIPSTIPAQQGFFIHCHAIPPGYGSVYVDNFSRVHVDHFLYKGLLLMDRLLILSAYGNSLRDEAQIWFNNASADTFEWQHDVYKKWGDNLAPQLYSELPDSIMATLNVIPWTGINRVIPMVFKSGVTGTDTIIAGNLQSFSESIPIWIHDLKESRIQELTEDPVYIFNSTPSDIADRFRIIFGDPATGLNGSKLSGLEVYSFEKILFVKKESDFLLQGDILLIDMTGRQVFSAKLQDSPVNHFYPNVSEGCYIVRLVSGGTVVNQKVFLK